MEFSFYSNKMLICNKLYILKQGLEESGVSVYSIICDCPISMFRILTMFCRVT